MQEKVDQWVTDEAVGSEYSADWGDMRLDRRARKVGRALAVDPGLSLPKLFKNEADLEAAYRLLRHEDIAWRDLLAPHVARTLDRATEGGEVVVAHDTTDLKFRLYWPEERRAHMTSTSSRTQGFLLHSSLCIAASGPALPLGVIDVQPFVHRSSVPAGDAATAAFWEREAGLFENEHERWARSIAIADDELRQRGVQPIHVMDRETDSYGLLSWLEAHQMRFVVRCDATRKLRSEVGLQDVGTVDAKLGERFPLRNASRQSSHSQRRARTARLTVRTGVVTLQRASKARLRSWSPSGFDQPKFLQLHLVEAIESSPPVGEQGVRWLLLTTEPIGSADEVLRVIDLYRRRWVIEEFFKALKTGCRPEQRQMEGAPTMLRMLALLLPAAWRLLLLRGVASHEPDARWRNLLTPLEFRILRLAYNRLVRKGSMTATATVAQCLAAIAKLGGHLPRNGSPGWQTLQAGWANLQQRVLGASLARDTIND